MIVRHNQTAPFQFTTSVQLLTSGLPIKGRLKCRNRFVASLDPAVRDRERRLIIGRSASETPPTKRQRKRPVRQLTGVKTCPECLSTDLPEAATKCWHCSSGSP